MELNSPQRKAAIQVLAQKGNFLHNCAVLVKQKGILFVLRRPDKGKPIDSTEYIPCIYCLGFIQKTQAHKHAKTVHSKKLSLATSRAIELLNKEMFFYIK